MDEIPLSVLFGALSFLIVFSAFFSSSETAMIALNRYRLRHLVKEGKRSAIISEKLLERPDRLIGLILLGNNLVNFFAASIATVIGIRLLGDLGIALAPIILVLVFLIFAEVMPKTIAAIHPEKIALPASYILNLLMKLAYPAVWSINTLSNNLSIQNEYIISQNNFKNLTLIISSIRNIRSELNISYKNMIDVNINNSDNNFCSFLKNSEKEIKRILKLNNFYRFGRVSARFV